MLPIPGVTPYGTLARMPESYHSDSSNLNLKNNLYSPESPPTKRVTAKQNKNRLEKEKPGLRTQAFCDSGANRQKSDVIPHPIIADAAPESSLRKNLIQDSRMALSQGYIRIPRSLVDDPYYLAASVFHKQVLLTIIKLACWRPYEFNDNGNTINLEPGQLCISMRELTKKCGKGITKNHVEGALKYFEKQREVRQEVRQTIRHEVRHKKTIITITDQDASALFKNADQTESQTNFQTESQTQTNILKNPKEPKDCLKEANAKREKGIASSLSLSPLFFESDEEKSKEFEDLWDSVGFRGIQQHQVAGGIAKMDVFTWLKQHSVAQIEIAILEAMKKPRRNYPSYIQKMLSAGIARERENEEVNRQWCEETNIEQYGFFEVAAKYLKDNFLKKEYYFHLPPEMFARIIYASIQEWKEVQEKGH